MAHYDALSIQQLLNPNFRYEIESFHNIYLSWTTAIGGLGTSNSSYFICYELDSMCDFHVFSFFPILIDQTI